MAFGGENWALFSDSCNRNGLSRDDFLKEECVDWREKAGTKL